MGRGQHVEREELKLGQDAGREDHVERARKRLDNLARGLYRVVHHFLGRDVHFFPPIESIDQARQVEGRVAEDATPYVRFQTITRALDRRWVDVDEVNFAEKSSKPC